MVALKRAGVYTSEELISSFLLCYFLDFYTWQMMESLPSARGVDGTD